VYAIVRIAGKQFEVRSSQVIRVPRVEAEVGTRIDLDDVLCVGDPAGTRVGTPRVDGARVTAEVVGHGRERKILVFHKKRRKDYKKLYGHRQPWSELRIHDIQVS
jgi:large subunit ribosomal protein L21